MRVVGPSLCDRGYARIMLALSHWSLVFICAWAPLAVALSYGFRGVSLDGASPAWMSMALVQLVALVTAGTLSADILVRMRPIDTSILYLRKFHAEPRQPFPLHPFDENSGLPSDSDRRTQNFRFAEMIEGAGLLGLRILALRELRAHQ